MSAPKKKGAPTQEHIPFTAVFQDTVILKNGEFRQILMVSSINFGLKSEEEQNAIVYSYQSFLNAVSFPTQILIRSRQIDLGEYIAGLKKKMFQQPNELIRYQTQEYIDFVSRLISIANIMEKKFFVVVPYTKPNVKHGLLTPKHGRLQVSMKEFEQIKVELNKRIEVVQQGLAALGLQTVILTTEQIIELLYASYNITESMRNKLENAEEIAQSTIVRESHSAPGGASQDTADNSASQPPTGSSAPNPNPRAEPYGRAPQPPNQSATQIPIQK